MPIALFIVPYTLTINPPGSFPVAVRSLDIGNDVNFESVEILGNRAIVRVNATAAIIQRITSIPGVKRLPKDQLNAPLSDLSTTVRTALRDELLDMGYTAQQITARFGNNLGSFTLGDVLRFMASKRNKPRPVLSIDAGEWVVVDRVEYDEIDGTPDDIDSLERIR